MAAVVGDYGSGAGAVGEFGSGERVEGFGDCDEGVEEGEGGWEEGGRVGVGVVGEV